MLDRPGEVHSVTLALKEVMQVEAFLSVDSLGTGRSRYCSPLFLEQMHSNTG